MSTSRTIAEVTHTKEMFHVPEKCGFSEVGVERGVTLAMCACCLHFGMRWR